MDSQTLLLGFSALAAIATVIGLTLPFLQKDTQKARLKAIARRRDELSRQARQQAIKERGGSRSKKHLDLMQKILQKIRLDDLVASKQTRQRLLTAGFRSPGAPVIFFFVRVGSAVALLIGSFLFMTFIKPGAHTNVVILVVIAGLAVGFFLPFLIVTSQAQKRNQEMSLSFPDSLDLMVICTEAGLSIEGAFARVTEELSDGAPTLSEELGLTSAELAFLGDRRKAYTNFADRTGLQSARALATALIQSEKYGTPVGQALKVLANENRQERMAKAERKAAALPAQLTVPMIVFFLPPLFAVIIGPAAIGIMGSN